MPRESYAAVRENVQEWTRVSFIAVGTESVRAKRVDHDEKDVDVVAFREASDIIRGSYRPSVARSL
jgi:hypothetical protein